MYVRTDRFSSSTSGKKLSGRAEITMKSRGQYLSYCLLLLAVAWSGWVFLCLYRYLFLNLCFLLRLCCVFLSDVKMTFADNELMRENRRSQLCELNLPQPAYLAWFVCVARKKIGKKKFPSGSRSNIFYAELTWLEGRNARSIVHSFISSFSLNRRKCQRCEKKLTNTGKTKSNKCLHS